MPAALVLLAIAAVFSLAQQWWQRASDDSLPAPPLKGPGWAHITEELEVGIEESLKLGGIAHYGEYHPAPLLTDGSIVRRVLTLFGPQHQPEPAALKRCVTLQDKRFVVHKQSPFGNGADHTISAGLDCDELPVIRPRKCSPHSVHWMLMAASGTVFLLTCVRHRSCTDVEPTNAGVQYVGPLVSLLEEGFNLETAKVALSGTPAVPNQNDT